MHGFYLTTILLTVNFLVAVAYSDDMDQNAEDRQIIRQYAGKLKGELFSALDSRNAIDAISVCSLKVRRLRTTSLEIKTGFSPGKVLGAFSIIQSMSAEPPLNRYKAD